MKLLSLLFAASVFAQSPNLTTLANPAIPFTRPAKPYVILRRDSIEAVIVDNSAVNDAVLPNHRAGYSGVATFSRQMPKAVVVGLGDPTFDADGRTIITEYDRFVLFNIYFPNGGRGPEYVTHKIAFYRHFLKVAQGYMQQGRSVIVTGDVNTSYAEIDIARPKENSNKSGFMPVEREAMGEFYTAGLIDTFRLLHPDAVKYTWWDQVSRARERNVGWRLDYFFVSPDLKDKIVDAQIHDDVMGSDHCPISLTVKV